MKEAQLIAPCGINCAVCSAYLRERNPCPGCRGNHADKPVTRFRCRMKQCAKSGRGDKKFCYHCKELPCEDLKRLDKRYRSRYHMSPMENLHDIKESGVRKFLESERVKWTCSACGGTICVHKGSCVKCGKERVIPT